MKSGIISHKELGGGFLCLADSNNKKTAWQQHTVNSGRAEPED